MKTRESSENHGTQLDPPEITCCSANWQTRAGAKRTEKALEAAKGAGWEEGRVEEKRRRNNTETRVLLVAAAAAAAARPFCSSTWMEMHSGEKLRARESVFLRVHSCRHIHTYVRIPKGLYYSTRLSYIAENNDEKGEQRAARMRQLKVWKAEERGCRSECLCARFYDSPSESLLSKGGRLERIVKRVIAAICWIIARASFIFFV